MTLAQFAIAVGATPKWVQNAASALAIPPSYGEADARRLGLARVLSNDVGMPLKRAYALAEQALADPESPQFVSEAADGTVQLAIDLTRYLSAFNGRLAAARIYHHRRVGRPPRPAIDPIEKARTYGIDISLLQSNLMRTPEERLRIAGRNAEFIRRLRGRAEP